MTGARQATSFAVIATVLLMLGMPPTASAQCSQGWTVVFGVSESPAPLSSLQVDIDYSGAQGEFPGSGGAVVCRRRQPTQLDGYNDNEATRTLAYGMIAISSPSSPPVDQFACIFEGDATLDASDFVPTVTGAQGPLPDAEPLDPEAVKISVALTCPPCGNGQLDDGETCDPGINGQGCCNRLTCASIGTSGVCIGDGLACTQDVCDVQGACLHPVGNFGMTCRAAVGDCDSREQCSGLSSSCPADSFKLPGSSCGSLSSTDCDTPDTCDGSGTCLTNHAADGVACDDTNLCTVDQCASGICQVSGISDCQVEVEDLSSGDQFGRAAALTDDYLVVGAPSSLNSGSGRAHVFLALEDGGFEEQFQSEPIPVPLQDRDQASPDMDFGASVDADADTIVVGAPFDVSPGDSGPAEGSASVFVRTGESWNLQAKLLDPSGECAQFGTDVAVSGDTVVVGAPAGGCAIVFARTNSTWSEASRLKDAVPGSRFGQAVDVSGTALLVGAPGAQSGLACGGDGKVFAYRRSGGGMWSLEDAVEAPAGGGSGSCFGAAVGVAASAGVVGAPGDDSAGPDAGAAYILARSEDGTWPVVQQLLAFPEGEPADGFGGSLDIKADLILAGAPGVGVYLFQASQPPAAGSAGESASPQAIVVWEPRKRYTPPNEPGNDGDFGDSVSVISRTVVIGAPRQGTGDLENAGAVFSDGDAPESVAVCGDGVRHAVEACDDGDTQWDEGQLCTEQCGRVACGVPTHQERQTPLASDALFVLRAAVGLTTCAPSVCDVDSSGDAITATDALIVLRKSVAQPLALVCPPAG